MTVPVLAKSAFTQTSYGELSAEIDVPEDGNTEWHLGFHVTSPAYKYCVYVKDIKITVAGSEDNPSPLEMDMVCDECNLNVIIPLRFGIDITSIQKNEEI